MSWVASPGRHRFLQFPCFASREEQLQTAGGKQGKMMLWLLQGIGTSLRNLVVLLAGDA